MTQPLGAPIQEACWPYQGCLNRGGYGVKNPGRAGGSHLAHVQVFEATYGPRIPGLDVRHRCDTRACINPDHLLQGTRKQNMEDMVERGRSRRGSRHHFAQLTDEQVESIRADGRYQYVIAAEYGVDQSTISRVKSRRTWKS